MKRIFLSLVAAMLCVGSAVLAQPSIGGTPIGISAGMGVQGLASETLTPLDMVQIDFEDTQDEKTGNYPRIAVSQQVNFTLQNSGQWTTMVNGDKVWRLEVTGPNATGLIFSLENFYLPPGAKLYAYSQDETEVIGGFTSANNTASGILAIGVVPSNVAIIEYYEPALVAGYGHFEITEIGQAYRAMTPQQADELERDFGDSDPCQVNVNCTPEGTAWQDEKRGVARILLKEGPSWGWCTGSLMNNTAQDCAPYFLTAHHCGENASAADQAQWFFYFNYESTGCSNGSNPVPNPYNPPAGSPTTQGCTFLSHSNDGGGQSGSDYKLVNLDNLTAADMTSWNLYLNGWDVSPGNSYSGGGVGMHHPAGDIKKISTYTQTLTTTQWNGNGLPSHWFIQWAATANGNGVTEGGSSGSPLFNSTGRVIGTLTGGSSFCTSPTSPDMYGKMSYHWDQNSNPFGGHLEVWLDPVGSGSNLTLDGTYPPCNPTAPTCAASASATSVVVGQSIDFFDNSSGVPDTWSWDFGDGSPLDPNQNPSHSYTAPGTYTVTLTASNAQGSCTTTIIIVVNASTGCDTLGIPFPGTPTVYLDNGGGYVAGTNSFGDLAKCQRYSGYAPYTHCTGVLFWFFKADDGGNGASCRFALWDEVAGEPGTQIAFADIPMSALAPLVPAGGGLVELFWNGPVNVGGNPFFVGVEMIGYGAGDTIAVVSNTIGDPPVSGQSWEQWNDLSWNDINTAWGGVDIDLALFPYMTDLPPTAGMTASATTICEGDVINFDASSSTNIDSTLMTFVSGTPGTSTSPTQAVTYSTAGTYTAYIQAFGACGGYHLDSIPNITVNAAPTVAATGTDETCSNADGTITATGGAQYSIDGGTNWQGSGNFTGLAAGTYTVMAQNAAGCVGQTQVTINQNQTGAAPTASATDENCGNADGTITGTATNPIQWSIDGGVTWQGSNVFTGLTAGAYTLTVEYAGGCQGSVAVTVNGNSATPTASNTFTDENCSAADGSITVTGTGGTPGYTYSIDGGTNFQASPNFPGLTAGTYNIVVMDAVGCTDTDVATLVNNGGATVNSVTVTDVTCNGAADGQIDVNATGAGLMYSIDGTNYQASNIFTGVAPGTYTIYVDNGACITQDQPHVVTEPATGPAHTAVVQSAGCAANGQIDVTGTGGTPGYTYSIDGGTNFQASPSFTGLAAGSYNVLIEDANGCQSTVSVETVGSLPALVSTSTGADETCLNTNGSISINATGGDGGPYQYSINGGSSYQGSGTFTGLGAGTYNISVIDGSGCVDTDVVVISNIGGVTVSTNGNQTICDGQSASLNASGATNYNWFDGGTPVGTGASISVTPTGTTTYTVIGDDGSCFDTTTVVITVNTAPTTTVTPDTTICEGESITLTAGGGTSYFWTHNGSTNASETVTPTNTVTTYTVTGFNGTCQGTTASVTVTLNPAPTAVAGSNVTVTYLGSGGQVIFDNTGSSGTSYNWDFGDGNSSTQASPTHNYAATGTYTVILTATLGPCTDTDTLIITVLDGVGIDEVSLASAVKLYPNPTNAQLFIGFNLTKPQDVVIQVVDAIGKLVETRTVNEVYRNTIELNLSAESRGVYFINIMSEGERVTKRVTLMK